MYSKYCQSDYETDEKNIFNGTPISKSACNFNLLQGSLYCPTQPTSFINDDFDYDPKSPFIINALSVGGHTNIFPLLAVGLTCSTAIQNKTGRACSSFHRQCNRVDSDHTWCRTTCRSTGRLSRRRSSCCSRGSICTLCPNNGPELILPG